MDFHTERHTSSLQPLFCSPRSPLEGPVDTGIASLSSDGLLPCARRVISKWFVCTETHRVAFTRVCLRKVRFCLCRRREFTPLLPQSKKSLLLKNTFWFFFPGGKETHKDGVCSTEGEESDWVLRHVTWSPRMNPIEMLGMKEQKNIEYQRHSGSFNS